MPFSVTVYVFWCELYKKVNMKLDQQRLKTSTSKMKSKLSVLFSHWGDKIAVAISLSCEIFKAVSAEKKLACMDKDKSRRHQGKRNLSST